jgi:hypothetical protein
MSSLNFDLNIKNYTLLELRKLLNLEVPFTESEILEKSDNIKNKILKDDTLSKKKKEELISFILKTEKILINDFKHYFYTDLSNNIFLKNRDFLCIPEIEKKPDDNLKFKKWPKGATVLFHNKELKMYQIYIKTTFIDEKTEWSIFNSQ